MDWCKNNSLKYDVPHYFDVMTMYFVDHTIVHQRVSHTISIPSICTWNNMVLTFLPIHSFKDKLTGDKKEQTKSSTLGQSQ